jgi:hypothetical protein
MLVVMMITAVMALMLLEAVVLVYEAFVSLYLNLYIYMFFPFQDSAIAKC